MWIPLYIFRITPLKFIFGSESGMHSDVYIVGVCILTSFSIPTALLPNVRTSLSFLVCKGFPCRASNLATSHLPKSALTVLLLETPQRPSLTTVRSPNSLEWGMGLYILGVLCLCFQDSFSPVVPLPVTLFSGTHMAFPRTAMLFLASVSLHILFSYL